MSRTAAPGTPGYREAKLRELRAGFAAWAFGGDRSDSGASPATADSLLVASEVVARLPASGLQAPPLELLEAAERNYRTMILRERDIEVTVIAESSLDEFESLTLFAVEGNKRYWLQEDERSARESVEYVELQYRAVAGCRAEMIEIELAEEAARAEHHEQRLTELAAIATEERPSFLAARRREIARIDAMRSRPNTPISVPPLTPSTPAAVPKPNEGPKVPKPPVHVKATLVAQFILDAERRERLAIIDGREAFVNAYSRTMASMHGAAPTFALFAIERDEDVERRAIASAYFDMLLSACRILESLRRNEIDIKTRRKELAAFVPMENQAWLRAKQRTTKRSALEEVHELQMEQRRRDAIHDREQRHAAERRQLSMHECNARVEVRHTESSERAIIAAQADTEWRVIREAELSAELHRQHVMSTLVWTEEAHDVCIVEERRLRQRMFHDEAEARRDLRSRELTNYMRARRAEALNTDVAKALERDYDDRAAAAGYKAPDEPTPRNRAKKQQQPAQAPPVAA